MFHAGQQIGTYILVQRLGRGGFGEVWLAERKSKFVTTKVAIKLPLDEQVDYEAIKQEATLWEQASGHPNILPIIEADEYDGQIVIVSEYASDGSLDEWLKRNGKMSVEKAVETTIQILDGLEFLHSRNIIHRDLKPANILLQGRTPRLADFGISRALLTTIASQSQHISGTFAYMSPEALDGKRSVQTDIWSVGVNLYQFLTGMLPFPQKEPSVLFPAIIMREFEPLPDFIPQSLKNVIAKALAKLPENRYKTAGEMRQDLQKILINIQHPTFAPTEVSQTLVMPTAELAAEPTVQSKPSNLEVNNNESVITKISDVPKPTIQSSPLLNDKVFAKRTEERSSLPMMIVGIFAAILVGGSIIGLMIYAMMSGTEKAQISKSDSNISNKSTNDDSILDFNDSRTSAALKDYNLEMVCNPDASGNSQGKSETIPPRSSNVKKVEGTDVRFEKILPLTDSANKPCEKGKPNPLSLVVEIASNGDLDLNGDKQGNALGQNTLLERLNQKFKERESNGVFREGTNDVETTVTLKVPPQINRDIFNRTLKIVRDSGASPINLYVAK